MRIGLSCKIHHYPITPRGHRPRAKKSLKRVFKLSLKNWLMSACRLVVIPACVFICATIISLMRQGTWPIRQRWAAAYIRGYGCGGGDFLIDQSWCRSFFVARFVTSKFVTVETFITPTYAPRITIFIAGAIRRAQPYPIALPTFSAHGDENNGMNWAASAGGPFAFTSRTLARPRNGQKSQKLRLKITWRGPGANVSRFLVFVNRV